MIALPPGGQGEAAMKILPPESNVAVRHRPVAAGTAVLARADAAAYLLADRDPAAALAALPHADLWRALHRSARRAAKAPLLVTRLPNARHTLARSGSCPMAPERSSASNSRAGSCARS